MERGNGCDRAKSGGRFFGETRIHNLWYRSQGATGLGGVREWLLETRRLLLEERDKVSGGDEFAGEIRIATNIFVRRVIFRFVGGGQPPRAIGVEFSRGR